MKTRFGPRLVASTAIAGLFAIFRPGPAAGQDVPPSAIDTWLANQPAEALDVAALGAKFTTPEEAFDYVRDHIAYEPYSGVMKGAAGALLTRGANDYDRALLLASLLTAQGVEVKLAYGTLTDAAAHAQLENALKNPDAVGQLLAALPDASAPPPGESFEQKARDESFAHGVTDRRAEMRLALAAQESLLKPLTSLVSVPAFLASRRCVWVQATIDGRTVDLDPAGSEAKFGEAPAAAEGTWGPDDIPDDERHLIVIRLVKETLADGRLTRHELLTKEFRPADLLATGFRLVITPKGAPESAEDFQPVLITPDDTTIGEVFRVSGEPPPPAESPSAGGLLGGFGGGAPEAAPAAGNPARASQLARLWVEIVFHSPGLPDETDRRTIVDRVEPRADAWQLVPALAAAPAVRPLLVQVWDAGVDVGAPHPLAWIQAEAATLKTVEPLRSALTAEGEINPDDLPAQSLAPPLEGFFLMSGLGRHRLAADAATPTRLFLNRPRLAFLRHGFIVPDWTKPGTVPPRYAEGIDLVNEPLHGVGGAEAGALALQAGVIDTMLEQYVLNQKLALNTVPLFAAAQESNVRLVIVSAAAQLDRIATPAAIHTALLADLAQGRVLLVPERLVDYAGAPAFGWWSLDPRSGAVVGKMDLGSGQAMMEYSKVTQTMADLSRIFGKLMGNMIRCYGGAIGAALGSGGPAKPKAAGGKKSDPSIEAELLSCLQEAACAALKDFYSLAKTSFGPEKEGALAEIKEMKKMIKELDDAVNEMAKGSESKGAFAKGCQLALGGGGE